MSDSAASEVVAPPPIKRIKLSETDSEEDRLSDLPESIILHTLSFLNTKRAVQTSVLSKRWKDLWKRVPALTLHSADFGAYKKFTRLVSKVLSLRDTSISLHSLDFKRSHGRLEPNIKKIVNYALSHNVRRLGLNFNDFPTLKTFTEFVSNVLSHRDSSISLQTLDFKRTHGGLVPQIIENIVDYALSNNVQQLGLCFNGNIEETLPSMFSSQTLTHLNLSIYPSQAWFPKSFNLPALTNLRLENFIFYIGDDGRAEPFSIFNKLNNLTICSCAMEFVFTGAPIPILPGSNVSSLKHVDIHAGVKQYHEKSPLLLSRWLLVFANIKSLTISATTLQVLSLIPNLSEICPPSLRNLKSLKVKMEELTPGFRVKLLNAKSRNAESKNERKRLRKKFKEEISGSLIPNGIVNFLLQNSPSAEVEFIDCKATS
ncbi:hypothetical protein TSUD_304200 [Trifolium subterraneum]|uniref:F-box domain-containing protein n=1 Tax=Trifolium subterraneum TaxID=3900 RepID=A0A2Z6MK65_TRISU|nr:hypothetical protein TSUD_304200 [Trifolium subterraneum]